MFGGESTAGPRGVPGLPNGPVIYAGSTLMATNRRYRRVVPDAVQRLEEGWGASDWFVASSEGPIVVNNEIESLLSRTGDPDRAPRNGYKSIEGSSPDST